MQEALNLLTEMSAADITPNVVSYAMVLSACGQAGQVREALSTLDRLLAAGVHSDKFCMSATLKACAKAGQWE